MVIINPCLPYLANKINIWYDYAVMRAIKCAVAYLLMTVLICGSFVSYAREGAESDGPAYSLTFDDSLSANVFRPVISYFEGNGLPDRQRELWIEDGLTLDEVVSLLPEEIPAVMTDGEQVMIPVEWESDVEYDPEANHFYMFTALWDTETYGDAPAPGKRIPHIFVIIDREEEDYTPFAVGGSAAGNEKACFDYFVETMKLSPAAACGILANIRAESNFNTGAVGDQGTSYGICQWHNSRWTALNSFCEKNQLDPSSLEGQLRYLRHELETGYKKKVLDPIRSYDNSAQGAYDSAYCFCVYFEVPANKEIRGDSRGVYARDVYWPKYGGYGVKTTRTVSLKQVRKANIFLSDAKALYDVESPAEVRDVSAVYDGEAGFAVSSWDPESGLLTLSADRLWAGNLSSFTKKVRLRFEFEDENNLPVEKTVTVGTASKAPVSLKAGKAVIYEGWSALVSLYEKNTGNAFDISGDDISVFPSKPGLTVEKSDDRLLLTIGKGEKKWSGKLNVIGSGWTKPVQVSLTVKRAVIPKKPLLDAGSVTLYSAAREDTGIVRVITPGDISGLRVSGTNRRSSEAINDGLIGFVPVPDRGEVHVSLSEDAEQRLVKGTYSFSLIYGDYEKPAALSVRVVKDAVSVKYKADGAIDLTRRSSSIVTFTPQVKRPYGAKVLNVSVDSIECPGVQKEEEGETDLRSGFRFVEIQDNGTFSLRYAYGSDDLHVGKYRVKLSGYLDDRAATPFTSEVLITVKQSLPAAKIEPSEINTVPSALESGLTVSVTGNGKKCQDLRVVRESVNISAGGDEGRFVYEDGRITSTERLSSGEQYRIRMKYRYYGQDDRTPDRIAVVRIVLQ